MKKDYDFSGYVTKNDLLCSDGRIIRHGAFSECDGKKVPLVYQHDHTDIDQVVGHALLEQRDDGMYGYCSLNNTPKGQVARELVEHGDIVSMSIYANRLRQNGKNVVHGIIREVSLVLAGANPGAYIDNIQFAHADGFDVLDDEAIIYSGLEDLLVHADDEGDEKVEQKKSRVDDVEEEELEEEELEDDEDEEEDEDDEKLNHADQTLGEWFAALSQQDQDNVSALVGLSVAAAMEEDDDEAEHDAFGEDYLEGDEMKHNVFDTESGETSVLTHSDMTAILSNAKRNGSLREAVSEYFNDDPEALQHGITDIEVLFPEAQMVGGTTPGFIQRRMEWVGVVMNGVHKSPFARFKSNAANITMDEARARGYIKGNQKVEEQFSVMKRSTDPTTIYKLQKFDRDDIIDITDFDVVAWVKGEMRMMLDEEIARAILVGDGRSAVSDDKIDETHIRPIWTDDEMFSVHTVMARGAKVTDIIDQIIRMKKEYKGSGQPTMFIGTDLLTEMRLLKDGDGHRMYKTDQELADDLRVSKIVEVEIMDDLSRTVNGTTRDLGVIIVNLADYNTGANRGGQVTMFDDFDLNFNKQEYLLETRMSGALYQPKSALVLEFADQAIPNMYVAKTPTTANPKTEGLYEKEGKIYIPTRDTEVVSGKTYYELA